MIGVGAGSPISAPSSATSGAEQSFEGNRISIGGNVGVGSSANDQFMTYALVGVAVIGLLYLVKRK